MKRVTGHKKLVLRLHDTQNRPGVSEGRYSWFSCNPCGLLRGSVINTPGKHTAWQRSFEIFSFVSNCIARDACSICSAQTVSEKCHLGFGDGPLPH